MSDLIKCPICGSLYNPVYLVQVLEHMHSIDAKIIPLAKNIKGKKVIPKKQNPTAKTCSGDEPS